MPSPNEWLIIVLSAVFTPEPLQRGLTLIGASPGAVRLSTVVEQHRGDRSRTLVSGVNLRKNDTSKDGA
jgi:hypothetical protein